MEIAEEEEEGERERKRQSTVKEEERPTSSQGAEEGDPVTVLSPAPGPAVTLNSDLATSPEESQFAGTLDPPTFTGAPRPSSPAKSFDDAGRRNSSQSARPDLYSYSSYGKKVKLGPRPSLETSGRPRTSAGTGTYRPVSSIPAGFKLSSKGSKKSHSQHKIPENEENEDPSVVKEEGTETGESVENQQAGPEKEPARPHTSSGELPHDITSEASLKSNLPTMPPPPTKQSTMTPEKARLLKAMKLREKKKRTQLANEQSAEEPSEPDTPGLASDGQHDTVDVKHLAESDESAKHADGQLYLSQADSAIGIDVANDQSSIDTRTDFHLDSPTGALSDIGDSTKASSLSESTDETLQPDHLRKDSPFIDGADDDDNVASGRSSIDHQEDAGLDAEPVPPVAEPVPVEEQAQSTPEIVASEVIVEEERAEKALGDGPPDSAAETVPGEGSSEASLLVSKFASTPARDTSEREPASVGSIVAGGDNAETPEDTPAPAASGSTPDSPQFRAPVSRFSTQDAKPLPTTPTETTFPISFIVTSAPAPEEEAAAHDKGLAKESDTEETGRASVESRRSKRRANVEPIRTDLDPDKDRFQAESDLSDDDELMEELQSATLQQAKPMTVSKSPIAPAFPIMSPKRSNTGLSAASMDSNGRSSPTTVRTVSNPIRGSLLSPADVTTASARTVSSGAAFLHKLTQQTSSADLRPKSGKIGSSISQRIKALEKLSSSTGGSDAVPPKERPSSTFFSVRKTSPCGEPARSPSVLARASAALQGTTPSPPESRDSSPETGRTPRDRSGSMASRLSMFETGNAPRGRPESIQVTARIIRDPAQPFPRMPEPKSDPSDYSPLNLKHSPLVVDHRRGSPSSSRPDVYAPPEPAPAPVEPPAEPQSERRLSLLHRRWSKGRRSQSEDRNGETTDDEPKDEPSNRPRRRSSLTVVKDFIKDRRDSLLGGRSPSTDNLSILSPQNTGNLASPALPTPSSRSGSRPPSVHQNSMFPRRLSINSRRSSIDKSPALQTAAPLTGGLSPSLMTEATGEYDSDDRYGSGSGDKYSRPGSNGSSGALSPGHKSANRATRFMRRLSNTIGSRKNVAPSISPTVAEEDDAAVADQYAQHPPQSRGSSNQQAIATYLGDVNVQFPDTLLWKRRTMCLDSQGFLILSAVQGVAAARDSKQAGAVKRYHLSDFRTPYIPEMEVQELPNSVVLDFVDGSGVQIACEDRAGQLNTLHSEFILFIDTVLGTV